MARRLGGYEILGKLSDSATGPVYKARQLSMDRTVALKLLPSEAASDLEYVRRFVEEARAAGKVTHPNLVQVYEVAREGATYFFSMEFVEGKTLRELIDERGRFDPTQAARMVQQIASALQEAHANGLIHGDIKPDNVIVAPGSVAKLAELGLAKRTVGEEEIVGTADYMPPEQSKGEDVDGRADIYALGATFYHALTGAPPFEGKNPAAVMVKHATEPLELPSKLNPAVPASLDAIVRKMMAKRPEERHQKASEVVRALQTALSGKRRMPTAPRRSVGRTRTTLSAAAIEQPPFLAGRGPFFVAGALISVALVASAGIMLSRPKPETFQAEAALAQARELRHSGELKDARRLLRGFLDEAYFKRNQHTASCFRKAQPLIEEINAALAEKMTASVRAGVEGLRGTTAECEALKAQIGDLELSFRKRETDVVVRKQIEAFAMEMRRAVDDRRDVYFAEKRAEEIEKRRMEAKERLRGAIEGGRKLAAGGEAAAAIGYLDVFVRECATRDERAPLELLKTEIVGGAKMEFDKRLDEARKLAESGNYAKAIRTIERLRASAALPALKELAAREITKLAAEKARKEAEQFRRDRDAFKAALTSAKESYKSYGFSEAVRSLESAAKVVKAGALKEELRIETEFAKALKRAFDGLLTRINEGEPKLKISVATKRTEGDFISADEEKCRIRYRGMEQPKPWAKFSPVEMARLIVDCSGDALAQRFEAGFFCAAVGVAEEAQGQFGMANLRDPKATEAALRRYAVQLAPVMEAKDLEDFDARLAEATELIQTNKCAEALELMSKLREEFAGKRFMAAKAGRLEELEKLASAGAAAEAVKPAAPEESKPGPAVPTGGPLAPQTPEGLKKLGWEVVSGNWEMKEDGTIVGEAGMGPAIIEHETKSVENFAVQFKACVVSGEGCRMRFRWSSAGFYGGTGYAFHFMRTRGRLLSKTRYWFWRNVDPEGFRILKDKLLPGDRFLTYLVSMQRSRMEVAVNGKPFLSAADHRLSVGALNFAIKSGKVEFRDIVFREMR